MRKPFKNDGDYDNFVSGHRIDQTPCPWKVIFPEVIYPEFLYIDLRDLFLWYLRSAERVLREVIESPVEPLVEVLFLGLESFRLSKSFFNLSSAKTTLEFMGSPLSDGQRLFR